MRGFMFRDQVNVISSYFEQWNHCEQLVFLYALLQKLTVTQSKFLKMVLQQSLKQVSDLQHIENEANDPSYVINLCNNPKDYVVDSLLSHLPLLHPDNENAKAQYMMLIPKVLNHSLENREHIEECRHLLSYAIIHPAISSAERRSLALWMQNLEDTIKKNQNIQMSSEDNASNTHSVWQKEEQCYPNKLQAMYSSLQGLGSRSLPAGLGTQLSHAVHQHSNFATTPNAATCGMINKNEFIEGENGNSQRPYLRRRSKSYSPVISSYIASNVQNDEHLATALSNEENLKNNQAINDQAPLSPQGSVSSGSGSSESAEEPKNSFNTEGSGMRDVLGWLKSLRLHKYSHLFAQMTYDEMMNLTEEQLENQSVTKGARHKIVLSIQKLKERPENIRAVIKSITEGGDLRDALTEMKILIQTPIKAYNTEEKCSESQSETPPPSPNLNSAIPDEDLPSLLTSVMAKMCSQLLVSNVPDDENFSMYILLIDKCLGHEAFTPTQKRRLFSWKQQVQKVWHPLPPRRSLDNRINRSLLSHTSGTLPTRRRVPVLQPRSSNSLMNKPVSLPIQPVLATPRCQQGAGGVKQSASLNEHVKPPSLNIQRRNSAPVRSNQLSVIPTYKPVPEVVDPELDTRLRSLCLSMTEHALAGSDGLTQY